MLPGLTGLFEDIDVVLAERSLRMVEVVLVDELRQAQRTGQSGRAAADDDNVGFHLGAVNVFEGLAEMDHGELGGLVECQTPLL